MNKKKLLVGKKPNRTKTWLGINTLSSKKIIIYIYLVWYPYTMMIASDEVKICRCDECKPMLGMGVAQRDTEVDDEAEITVDIRGGCCYRK